MPRRLLQSLFVLGVVSLLLGLAACGGNSSSTNPAPSAPSLAFTADSTAVNAGQVVTFTWSTTNATSLTVTPSITTNALPLSGSQAITANSTTTYTATAVGPGGSKTVTATINVTAAAPTLTFAADSTSVSAGGTVNLTWSTTNTTSLTITPAISTDALPVSGTQPVTVNSTTTYTATATGAGGTTSQTVTITVTAAPPTMTFTSDVSSVAAGGLVTLTWTTTNATAFSVTPSILGEDQTSLGLSGTATVVVNTTTTFVATATGSGGTVTAQVTVAALSPAPTITFSALPMSIAPGASSTLSWTTTNATTVDIDNGVGTGLAPANSATVTPAATTTYTATATGPGGTATATVTVTVSSALSITLTASPTSISPGGSSTLTWVSNGTSVTISGINGTQSPSGSLTVTPSATTAYTATATDNSLNTATSTATVTVVTSGTSLNSIKHIIFMIQENRSFDNYFGKLGAYRVNSNEVPGALASDVNDLDSLPSNFALKTKSTAPHPNYPIPPFHERTLQTENLSPSWNESHYDAHLVGNDYLNVTSSSVFKMDQFLQTTHSVSPDKYDPDGTRPLGYYDQTDLPYYYELATQFATSDAFHSSLLSQTNPNRMYLFSATSIGRCNADPGGHPLWTSPTIFDSLVNAGVSWRYYYQDGVFLSQFASWNNPKIQGSVYNISNLFSVLSLPNADQQLPAVIFIEKGDATDEHPDNNIQAGAVVVKQILDALMASSAWHDSIFILAYDEGGGTFDHVPPFMVTPPDGITPNCPSLTPALFNLSGFRVPMIAISPYSKPHYVSHTSMETTSILKLIEKRFNLLPLTARDGDPNASDMEEFFDFNNPPSFLTPPVLPDQPNECLNTPSRCSQQLEEYPNLP